MLKPLIQVLLVEDSAPDAVLLRETLAESAPGQFAVTNVASLAAARECLRQQTYDVLLADLGLPDSHGAASFEQLRQSAVVTPIIVLTGLDDEELAIRIVNAGAQDYLVKGRVPGDLLVRALRYAIVRQRIEYELQRRNEEMAKDLAMAREFQQAFLPRKFPTFPAGVAPEQSALHFFQAYWPSSAVGGDFYSVLPLDDTRAGIFLCDVMGHGIRAALVTAMIRGLLEELRPYADEPSRFLAELNHALFDVLPASDTTMFVTAFYLVADTRARTVAWATAGHPSPLFISHATGGVAPLSRPGAPTGPVLGLFESPLFPATTAPVNPGDFVLLFTDGLYEALNPAGVEFGLASLQARVQALAKLPPPALFEELLATVRRFTAPDTFTDDVCLLGVGFDSPV